MDISKIEEMIRIYPQKDILPCCVAHYIASCLKITPREVGDAATTLKVRLELCQLGLYGYGRKGTSDYKILGKPVNVPLEFLENIRATAKDGRISCKDLWDIADTAKIPRPEAGNAADSLGLKITPCQLGAFEKK